MAVRSSFGTFNEYSLCPPIPTDSADDPGQGSVVQSKIQDFEAIRRPLSTLEGSGTMWADDEFAQMRIVVFLKFTTRGIQNTSA
jgi:hypothetical protein